MGATSVATLLLTGWWQLHAVPAPERSLGWLAARAAVVLGAAGLLAARLRPRLASGALVAFGVLTAAELGYSHASAKHIAVMAGPFRAERAVAQELRDAGLFDASGVPPRVAVPPYLIRDNSGVFHGYSNFAGYVPLGLDRVWTYLHERLGVPFPFGENEFPSLQIYAFGPFPYDSMNLVLGFDAAQGRLVVNPRPDPRAYVAGRALVLPHWREAVRRMREGHDFHAEPLLESAPPFALDDRGTGTARIARFEPERVEVEVESPGRGLLVLAEPWYPGWRARVDGVPVACVAANAWMRAAPVPAGRSRVVFEYRSRYLGIGAVVSLVALVLLGLALRRGRTEAVFSRPLTSASPGS